MPLQRETAARLTNMTNRGLAALAYLGGISLFFALIQPRSRFVYLHTQAAIYVHLVRLIVSVVIISGWTLRAWPERSGAESLVRDTASILIIGLPSGSGVTGLAAALLTITLGTTWVLGLAGALLAASGRSFDLRALADSDWSDRLTQTGPEPDQVARQAAERKQIQRLTEQRIERIWETSRVAANERRRRERMNHVSAEQDEVVGRLAMLNRMLAVGELSISRFNALHADLFSYFDALRLELTALEQRRADVDTLPQRTARPASLDNVPDVRVVAIAIVDRSGMPLLTYGQFALDESMITGMVAALDSLTEEMFGSRVHKTQLAEGQVVHFARGQQTATFVIFEDEPAPNQIARLSELLEEFEAVNAAELAHLPIDTARLQEVAVPFTLVNNGHAHDATPLARRPASGSGESLTNSPAPYQRV